MLINIICWALRIRFSIACIAMSEVLLTALPLWWSIEGNPGSWNLFPADRFMKEIGSQYGIISGTRENSLYNALWVAQALLRKG